MKQVFKYILAVRLVVMIFICLPSIVSAQPDPGCNPDGFRSDGTFCPIDNGLVVLLAFGVLYGIKRYRDATKSKVQLD
jgi:hypothetical protein